MKRRTRTMALPLNQMNPDMLLPFICIGAGLVIPFVTIANLLLLRYLGA